MTVCRYFERGTCRYGDRCRFEHIKTNYDSYNESYAGNYQEQRYGRQETGYSNNYYRNDNQQRNQRYESGNYYNDQREYSPVRYQENYRYQSPARSGGYDNQYEDRYKQDYDQQPRYSERNYGKKQHDSSNYRGNENVHSQNRFQWLSDDYRKQRQSVDHNEDNYVPNSYSTSTPKGKVSFSFKVPESEIRKDSSTARSMNEQDYLDFSIVKEDANSWKYGGQWPFTSYFPLAGKHGFPGFYDVSPEELRYAAYNAEKNNSYESYVQGVQNALTQVDQQRSELQVATPQLLKTLKRMRNGEDLYSSSKLINPISSVTSADTAIESMETAAFSVPPNSAAASFSFKIPSETDSAAKASATSFSFKLPPGTETKAVPATVSDGDTNIYTPMSNLTDEEKEQFSASTFVLGKIPTKPPPQVFCM